MNSNHKICMTAHKAIIECIALLNALRCYTMEFCWFVLRPAPKANGYFDLLHGLWVWKHYLVHKLVWKPMN